MKTPIRELYEHMEQNQYFIGNDLYAKYKEMLKKEREIISKAYDAGIVAMEERGGVASRAWCDFDEWWYDTFVK